MSYGQVTIDGKTYVERTQIFPLKVNVTVNGQIITGQQIVLPGLLTSGLKV